MYGLQSQQIAMRKNKNGNYPTKWLLAKYSSHKIGAHMVFSSFLVNFCVFLAHNSAHLHPVH